MCDHHSSSIFRKPPAARSSSRDRGGELASTPRARLDSTPVLGTNAKYKFKPEKVDPDTGEITGCDPMGPKVQRFVLQSVARTLFDNKTSRLNKCLRLRAAHQDVQVWKSIEHKTTHYKGLQTCGSVWVCPVCSAKIAERRRVEIIHAMDAHRVLGGCVNMLTLTAPHQVKDNLVDLLAKQAKALNLFWSDRVVKEILSEMGTIGQIRALELTHGRLSPQNNGWHPHYHVLMFQGSGVDLMRFDQAQMVDWQVRLYLRWSARCVAAGLGQPSYAHGLKLDNGDQAAKYVSKWGLEDEMTKGHTKKALHGETPFDFLRSLLADKGDDQAAYLFIEYAKAFKGKRQLHWSKGLKKRYAVTEKTDEALSAETDDKALLLGLITVDQWRDVLAVDGRGVVLQVASSGGWDSLLVYLETIKGNGVKKMQSNVDKKSVVVSLTTDNQVTTSYQNFTLGELADLMARPPRRFEVMPRPSDLGGGWKLTLFEGLDEMGGGVFPAGDDGHEEAYNEGYDWQFLRV